MKGGDGAMVQWCKTNKGAESLQSLFPFINNLRAIVPLERASSHATGGCQCREESCEGGYRQFLIPQTATFCIAMDA